MMDSDHLSPEDPSSLAAALAAKSDHTLLQLIRAGRDDAATAFYLRYARRLRALARAKVSDDLSRRVESDDIVQSVFRTFFRKASRGLYDVPKNEEIWKLLLVLALNKIRAQANYHHAAKRDSRQTVDDQSLESSGADDDALAVSDLRMVMDEVLGALPAGHRPIVEARLMGNEVEEIAVAVGRSKRTVERALQEFREKLRQALELPKD